MDFALTLADRADAAVTALHVVETIETRPELSRAMTDLQQRRCDTEIHSLEEMNATRAGGKRITNAVTLGRPYLEILRMAEERAIDLIVMGVRGRGAVDNGAVWIHHEPRRAARRVPCRDGLCTTRALLKLHSSSGL